MTISVAEFMAAAPASPGGNTPCACGHALDEHAEDGQCQVDMTPWEVEVPCHHGLSLDVECQACLIETYGLEPTK